MYVTGCRRSSSNTWTLLSVLFKMTGEVFILTGMNMQPWTHKLGRFWTWTYIKSSTKGQGVHIPVLKPKLTSLIAIDDVLQRCSWVSLAEWCYWQLTEHESRVSCSATHPLQTPSPFECQCPCTWTTLLCCIRGACCPELGVVLLWTNISHYSMLFCQRRRSVICLPLSHTCDMLAITSTP